MRDPVGSPERAIEAKKALRLSMAMPPPVIVAYATPAAYRRKSNLSIWL
jgi:hypothetical protein